MKVKTAKWVRVVGYYGAESAMNDGKKQENADRVCMTEANSEHRQNDSKRS